MHHDVRDREMSAGWRVLTPEALNSMVTGHLRRPLHLCPVPRLNHPRSLYCAASRLYVPASCYSSDAPEEFLFVCFQAAKWDIRVVF